MFPAAKDSAGKPCYPYHQSDISEEEFGWKGVGVVVVVVGGGEQTGVEEVVT